MNIHIYTNNYNLDFSVPYKKCKGCYNYKFCGLKNNPDAKGCNISFKPRKRKFGGNKK